MLGCEFEAGERLLVTGFTHVGLPATRQLQREQHSLQAGRLWLSHLNK